QRGDRRGVGVPGRARAHAVRVPGRPGAAHSRQGGHGPARLPGVGFVRPTRGGNMDPADLKRLPLFESLNKRELERLGRWVDEVDVPEGRHVVDQGQLAWEFFVILEGQAEVLHDGKHLADLGPGDYFGEMALLEGTRRNASVVAKSPIRL